MISDRLFESLRCPRSGAKLIRYDDHLQCPECGDKFYFQPGNSFIDMRPQGTGHRDSVYGNEAFLKKKGLMSPGPPFLSGGIKNWVLSRMLEFKSGDKVLDGGCGPGRYILWNLKSGAHFIGIDQEPFFADETAAASDLVCGYLHYLPFADNSFDYIICFDVLEHMAIEDINTFVKGAQRILKKSGKLLIYTNSVESSALAPLIRFRQRITAGLVKMGLIDLQIEKESKEDHVNAIKTRSQLIQLAEEKGLSLYDSAYYNPLIMGWFENLFVKIAEGRMNKKLRESKGKKTSRKEEASNADAKTLMKSKSKKKGLVFAFFWVITQIMKLDILLFSSIESGQFFLLFQKEEEL